MSRMCHSDVMRLLVSDLRLPVFTLMFHLDDRLDQFLVPIPSVNVSFATLCLPHLPVPAPGAAHLRPSRPSDLLSGPPTPSITLMRRMLTPQTFLLSLRPLHRYCPPSDLLCSSPTPSNTLRSMTTPMTILGAVCPRSQECVVLPTLRTGLLGWRSRNLQLPPHPLQRLTPW